jgi:peptidoglycan/LPS O-acetylase OafA/YrhL
LTSAKLDALTGLRIVAAGMIVAHHSRALQIPVPNYALDHGVSFFFVLSGFIIAYAYPRFDDKSEVFKFLIARIARIWPAHFAALLLAIALLQLPLDRTLLANVLLLQGWMPSLPWYFSYNAPSWSVSTELFFYIAFPLLIFRWNRSWWWKWAGSLILVVSLIWLGGVLRLPTLSQSDEPTLHGLLYINPLARLFEFTTGMVAYSVFRRCSNASLNLSNYVFIVLEILVVIIAVFSIVTGAPLMILAPYFQGAGTQWLSHTSDVLIWPSVIVVFAFGRGWLSFLFGSSPMIFLGEISFSVYLVHSTIFGFYARHLQTDTTRPDYLGLAICVGATLALAFAIWVVVEVPCRSAVKRWLKNRPVFVSSPSISQET